MQPPAAVAPAGAPPAPVASPVANGCTNCLYAIVSPCIQSDPHNPGNVICCDFTWSKDQVKVIICCLVIIIALSFTLGDTGKILGIIACSVVGTIILFKGASKLKKCLWGEDQPPPPAPIPLAPVAPPQVEGQKG